MTAYGDYTAFSDDELLLLVADNNEKAFEIIYERYWLLLLNTANKRLQNKDASMDIVQNVFIDLWERRHKTVITHLKAYLMQAIRFQVYKFIEKVKGKSAFLEMVDIIDAASSAADYSLLNNELLAMFQLWVEALPEKQKRIFRLYYENNLSTRQISAHQHIPVKTVQNQLGITFKSIEKHLHKTFLILFILHIANIL
jgi:RNA polymerase sigma factor (sigma-70 family)